ncbi:hypothetical protein W97_05346 [Coniosporium apollinis CBS 100218]|uniref:Azaphilone pigments biosynthesis cluster protein L N-terminal domain-containing protein n=1 Tax=Coniosporium apollinis (strain CBS 100218) TaxID=1168221 RepID=R7YWA3_CONA1|nr:uncharacterized protein W97_05346 [Coniosporium apollinis CBS 100218]EON66103.1 hypothetical protein W97_05346 [Coniosporium apollinis CBS 100218]
MDPLSITASCFTLAATITRVSFQVTEFVREVRDARSDLDAVARELLSIKTVLEILADDAKDPAQNNFPPTLGRQVTGILANCNDVVAQIERLLSSYQGSRLTKGTKWALNGRGDAGKLRSTLEAHKTALDIALDMVALSLAREIKSDTQEILQDTSAIRDDTALILAEIARLQARLPRDDAQQGSSGLTLQRYLDNLTTYAETVCDDGVDEQPAALADHGESELSDDGEPEPPESNRRHPSSESLGSVVTRLREECRLEEQIIELFVSRQQLEGGGEEHHAAKQQDDLSADPSPTVQDVGCPVAQEHLSDLMDGEPKGSLDQSSQCSPSPKEPLERNYDCPPDWQHLRVTPNAQKIRDARTKRKALDLVTQRSYDVQLCRAMGARVTALQVRDLLEKGADPNAVAYGARDLLEMRADTDAVSDEKMLKFLVANGASVHDREEDDDLTGLTPLFAFVAQSKEWTASQCNIIDALIKAGANVNESQGKSRFALQTLVRSGDAILVSRPAKDVHVALARLLSHGADANVIGGYYGTALHATVITADLESARVLLRYGATSISAHCNYDTRNFLGTITNDLLGTWTTKAGIMTPVELASKPLRNSSAFRTATIKREIQKKMKESANRAVA